jgi:hypothetical protein
MSDNTSRRGYDWNVFAIKVWQHIENYTVPQYGDRGEDSISEWSAEDCMKQVERYVKRFGKNARPGQEKLDLLKAAHYIQCAYDKMKD